MNRRWIAGARVALVAVLLVVAALSVTLWAQPFGRDQGIFAYIGEGVLDGRVPFRDAWDHKPPGIDFTYALSFAAFGRRMASIHILETLAVLLATTALYGVGRRLLGDAGGVVAALLYGAGTVLFFEWWDHGQAEMFMALLMTLAVYFATAPRRPEWALILAGFFASVAVDFKPTAAVFLVVLIVGAALLGLYDRREKAGGWTAAWRAAAILAAGAMLGQAPLILYFAAQGALPDLYEAVWVFNTYHVRTGANLAPEDIVFATVGFGQRLTFLGPLACLGLVSWLARREWRGAAVVLGWLIAALVGVWMQGKFFSYHWSVALPPLALLGASGLGALWRSAFATRRVVAPWAKWSVLGTVAVLVVLAFGSVAAADALPKLGRDLGYLTGRQTERQYLANFGHNIRGSDVYSFLAARDTADYLAAHTDREDTVFVWGFQALVNYLADRTAPTRYVFNYPLSFEQPESEFRQQARDTVLADLRRRKPAYVVTVTNDVNPVQTVDSRQLLEGFPELKAMIAKDYVLETDIADFHLYRRVEKP